MLFDAVCVWGWPLHTHTHSYIHNGFFRAAQSLGIRAIWLDNTKGAGDGLGAHTLFITEGQVDSNIPLRKDCFYVLHNCDAAKYLGLQVLTMQCLTSAIVGDPFLGKQWLVLQESCLYMPWATDLLPAEIDAIMEKLETIKKGPEVAFVGYFIEDPWKRAERYLQRKGIVLTKCGGYGLQNVSVEENVKRIQSARIAPALQPEEQIHRGYLPCRILKNISYGALGITNNPAVQRLFGEELYKKLIVGNGVEETLDQALASTMDFAVQRQLMTHIRDNHTFVNRLKEIEAACVRIGMTRALPSELCSKPKVVHLTFHAGCESDIVSVAEALGWDLKSFMLLRQPDASNEWYRMTDTTVSLLWTRFQQVLEDADIVITSDTAPLARIFAKHKVRRLIVWVCNRINYSCTEKTYPQEVRQLSREPWVKYVAYTPFEVDFAKKHNFDVRWYGTVRPLGRKVSANEPRNRQVFVGAYHNDAIALDLRGLVHQYVAEAGFEIATQTRYSGVAELSTFAAVIHIPYAASNLALFEALANGIPYIIPSETLMQRMIDGKERLPYRDRLFVPDSKASSMEWYRFADCLLTFDKFQDIPKLFQSLESCRDRMLQRYDVHAERTLAEWRHLVYDADVFATMAPLLRNAIKPYFADETFFKYFKRVPQGRDVTFDIVIQSLRALGREPVILELGTSRSFVDGRFAGCNEDDVKFWEPHVMDRWDWSAGCFTRVISTAFPKADITTVDLALNHLQRCRVMNQSNTNIRYVHKSSIEFLETASQRYDLVYIDTGDMTPIDATAAMQLSEVKLLHRVLAPNGLVLVDDVRSVVPLQAGHTELLGKAYKSLPWLIENGFYVSVDEYQTLLRQKSVTH